MRAAPLVVVVLLLSAAVDVVIDVGVVVVAMDLDVGTVVHSLGNVCDPHHKACWCHIEDKQSAHM